MQLPLVSKKRDALNFEDMKNPFCIKGSFINSTKCTEPIFDLVNT